MQHGGMNLLHPRRAVFRHAHVVRRNPAGLAAPPGPDRHLEPGDVVTAWIEGIGELTTTIA